MWRPKRNGKAESATGVSPRVTGSRAGLGTAPTAPRDDALRTGATRRLIVNADDFGRTEAVNKGVMLAYEEGIVTSASLMVRWPASEQAAEFALAHEDFGLGIHLDLGEWQRTGEAWEPVYVVAPTDDVQAVSTELGNQLGRFHKLMSRPPTHIDSHQHVHRSEPVASVVADFARRLGVPVRESSTSVRYCGSFYGQSGDGSPYPEGITVDALLKILDGLQPGVTELSCHPGLDDDLDNAYAVERGAEVTVLCDPRVRQAIDLLGISLVSYRTVSGA